MIKYISKICIIPVKLYKLKIEKQEQYYFKSNSLIEELTFYTFNYILILIIAYYYKNNNNLEDK